MDIEGKGLAKVVRLVVGPGNGLLLQLVCEIQPSLSAGFCIVTWLDFPLPPPPEKVSTPLPPRRHHGSHLVDRPPGFLIGVASSSERLAIPNSARGGSELQRSLSYH